MGLMGDNPWLGSGKKAETKNWQENFPQEHLEVEVAGGWLGPVRPKQNNQADKGLNLDDNPETSGQRWAEAPIQTLSFHTYSLQWMGQPARTHGFHSGSGVMSRTNGPIAGSNVAVESFSASALGTCCRSLPPVGF